MFSSRKPSGQIFSLDFLLSVIIMIAVIGSAMRYMELTTYDYKQIEEDYELERISMVAGHLVAGNKDFVCKTGNAADGNLLYWSNCKDSGNYGGLARDFQVIGVPAGYSYTVTTSECLSSSQGDNYGGSVVASCPFTDPTVNPSFDSMKDVITSQRKIIDFGWGKTFFAGVGDQNFLDCIEGSGTNCESLFLKKELAVIVWRQ